MEEDDFYPSSSFVNDLLGEGSQPSMVIVYYNCNDLTNATFWCVIRAVPVEHL